MGINFNRTPVQPNILPPGNINTKGVGANGGTTPAESSATVEDISSQFTSGELSAEEATKKLNELGAKNITKKIVDKTEVLEFDYNGKHYILSGPRDKADRNVTGNNTVETKGFWDVFKKIGKIVVGVVAMVVCPPIGFAIAFGQIGISLIKNPDRGHFNNNDYI